MSQEMIEEAADELAEAARELVDQIWPEEEPELIRELRQAVEAYERTKDYAKQEVAE